MRSITALLLSSLLCLGSAWATPAAPQLAFTGENCNLQAPPADAGESFFNVGGVTAVARVHPRLSSLPVGYTGCQVLWSSINGGKVQRSVAWLRAGRVEATNPPPGVPLCAPGEKVSEHGCTSRREVLQVSFPPGCWERARQANALPQDCQQAFDDEFKLNDLIVD